MLFQSYTPIAGSYDELIDADGTARPAARPAVRILDRLSPGEFGQAQALAELSLYNQGVTFSVYSDRRGTEKIFPICLCPRVIAATEWARVERGLAQRITALCAFLDDVYGEQSIFRPGSRAGIPPELILGAKFYLPKLRGLKPPGGVRIPIAGIDLIRGPDGEFRVLEDNVRTPSGVSYVVENRLVTKRIFQGAVDESAVRPVEQYPLELAETLRALSPVDPGETRVVLLTPGSFNSAYFEHTFLARTMGIELVEPRDLFVERDTVFVRTTFGPQRVHVIYRRIDDAYLDPEFFRPDSLLGVPGLMRAYAAGRVTLVNAPGNGCADDKAVYPFVPDMIRYYLGEEPILAQVDTYVCARADDLRYVVENLAHLVVKAVDEAGGYGMLMGPQASTAERDEFRSRVLAEPRRYIAQHRIELSTCPTWVPERGVLAPRRVDLRPFILTRPSGSWVLPGGLTRVALVEGSYIVNSSQGGGSKDTWVQRGEQRVISRVADHCFWFGRYVDRAESTARLLQATRTLVFDADVPVTQCWQPLVIVSGEYPAFLERNGPDLAGNGEAVQSYMTWDAENLVSLRSSIHGARESARVIRDVLSLEVWEEVNELYLWSEGAEARQLYRENREQFYRRVRKATQLIMGLVRSTMLHDTPMSLLWMGAMLERVGQTARILDMHHHTMTLEPALEPTREAHQIVEVAVWLSLLRACSGYEAFVKRCRGRVTAQAVVSFLVFDSQFPRSLRYCLRSARKILQEIWPAAVAAGNQIKRDDRNGAQLPGQPSQERLADLGSWLDGRASALDLNGVHPLLTHVVDEIAQICSSIAQEIEGPEHLAVASQSQSNAQ